MKRRLILAAALAFALAAALMAWFLLRAPAVRQGHFDPPDGAIVTYFPAREPTEELPLVISSSMDAGFMRPFLLAYQRHYPRATIVYLQSRSNAFLESALDACHRSGQAADIYLTASTDHLVRLANENCAQTLPSSIGAAAPARAAWRDQVVAFTVEPAAFVFGRRSTELPGPMPTNHSQLLEWLRRLPQVRGRIGGYDIEASADGYNFAAADSRQMVIYGRLLEALGRASTRLYCCSNVMVDAVDRGEILFAYNVQLSYAYAAQRAGSRIQVVLPDDFQSLQTVSLMVPRSARSPAAATSLAAFLVSDEARRIALHDLAPPDQPNGKAGPQAEQLLAQASVTPLLLSLQDRARRTRLIREWREAIAKSASPVDRAP
ncbi:MAG TPA: substrate-binding domain-containing protein [Sphingomonas sp.]|nr:substrate-binding domain-containing protein [Sphingomonas sp.]